MTQPDANPDTPSDVDGATEPTEDGDQDSNTHPLRAEDCQALIAKEIG